MFSLCSYAADTDQRQWQALPSGQATCSSEPDWSSCPHILTDGAHARPTGGVHELQTFSLSGAITWCHKPNSPCLGQHAMHLICQQV